MTHEVNSGCNCSTKNVTKADYFWTVTDIAYCMHTTVWLFGQTCFGWDLTNYSSCIESRLEAVCTVCVIALRTPLYRGSRQEGGGGRQEDEGEVPGVQ